MVATVPFTAQNSTPATTPLTTHDSPLTSAWKPNADDHLIFKWVKMDGKSQEEVAHMFGISQPTVSRIVQRYERWQAHARERQDGRLDHTERLRAQRWLTYERNELILANCLRIASDMEFFKDISKSTTRRTFSNPAQESEVRTEHSLLDRSGIAARFLRLAFRINMEQFKLVQRDELPPAPPLTDDEIEQQFREAAAAAEELAQARRRSHERVAEIMAEHNAAKQTPAEASNDAADGRVGSAHQSFEADELNPSSPNAPAPADADQLTQAPPLTLNLEPETLNSIPPPTHHSLTHHSLTHHSPCPLNNLNNLNNTTAPEIAETNDVPCPCVPQPAAEKSSACPCITDHDQPPRHSSDPPNPSWIGPATAAAAGPTH